MTPIFGSLGAASNRGFGRITKGFSYNTEVLFTSVAAGLTWTKPAGLTTIHVECWGAGGTGGGATINNTGGNGGAGGQYVKSIVIYSSEVLTIGYQVGSGILGTTGTGSSGNDTIWDTNLVLTWARGGAGGLSNQTGNTLTLGSITGGVGDVVYKGGDGGPGLYVTGGGFPATTYGGNGGGGAGSTGNGSNNGYATENFGGAGGVGGSIQTGGVAGATGLNYGGGGSGAAKMSGGNRSGGAGAQGLIRIRYNI